MCGHDHDSAPLLYPAAARLRKMRGADFPERRGPDST